MRTSRLVPAVPALLLALSGCGQPQGLQDGPQEQPVRPTSVVREPVVVETAPLTVDPPGPTRSP